MQVAAFLPKAIRNLAHIMPGVKAPEALPTPDTIMNKTNAKKRFHLTDTDIKVSTRPLQ